MKRLFYYHLPNFLVVFFIFLSTMVYSQKVNENTSYESSKPTATTTVKTEISPLILVRQKQSDRQTSALKQYTQFNIDREALKKIHDTETETFTMDYPDNEGRIIHFKLTKNNILSDDFMLGINNSIGTTENLDMGVHYQGEAIVDGQKIICAFSFFNSKIEGCIIGKDKINITSLKTPAGEDAIAYNTEDMVGEAPLGCGNSDEGVDYTEADLQPSLETREAKCVRIWWESNYNVFQYQGSLQNTVAFNLSLFNAFHTIYINETIKVVLHHLEVWTAVSPYPNPSDPLVDDRDEYLIAFQTFRSGSFTGDLAGLVTQNNIGGVAAGFSGICNIDRNESMCISGLSGGGVGTYPNYVFNVFVTSHEFGHIFGSRHTHACVWNGNNTAIDGCAGYIEDGPCPLPPSPSGGGTIMSYCWNSVGVDFTQGFGPQPGNVIRNKVANGACLVACCNPAYVPTISANNPVCIGGTLNLSSSGGNLYSWTGPSGFKSTASNPSITNITAANAGIYYLTVTNSQGCIATTSINITIGASPTATATATPNPICTGNTLQLNSTGGSTYSWSGPGGFTSSLQNPTRANIQPSHGGTYSVTVTTSLGCTASASVSVTVSPTPTATIAATPNPVCVNDNLYLTSSGGSTYAWSGPNGYTSTKQNPIRKVTSTNFGGTYTVTVTNSAGCTATKTINVTVNPAPTGTISVSTQKACVGSTIQFFATGGTSYSWTGPQGFTSSAQNPTLSVTNYNQRGLYSVKITNTFGCFITLSIKIDVIFPPVATATHDISTACVGSTLKLFSTGAGSASWSGPNGFTSNNPNPTISNVNASHSGTYTVTITSSNGCQASASTTVNIVNPPVVTAGVSDNTVCEGSNVQLSSSGGVSYQWTGPYGYSSNLPNPMILNIPVYMSGTFNVTGTGPTGCTKTVGTLVQVYPYIVGSASASPNPYSQGQSVQLSATGGSSYLWSGPNGFHSTDQNPLIYNASYLAQGTYVVLVKNDGGCEYAFFVNLALQNSNFGIHTQSDAMSDMPQLYPNPSNNYIMINDKSLGEFEYRIVDNSGLVVLHGISSAGKEINIHSLSNGTYSIIYSFVESNAKRHINTFIKVK